MSQIVPADQIEAIVGVKRHATEHWGRAISAEQTVYILHSQECKDSTLDLRECAYSLALDRGIEDAYPWVAWQRVLDRPIRLEISVGYLLPESTFSQATRRGEPS